MLFLILIFSVRKNIESLKQLLTSIVIPIYCLTYIESNEEIRHRLLKLEKIWDSNNYLDKSIIEQLKNPQLSLNNYQQALCNEFGSMITPITAGTIAKFNQLQQQHNDFVALQNSKIQQLQVSTSLPTSLSMPVVIANTSSISQGPFLSSNHSSLPPFNQPPPTSVLSMLQPPLNNVPPPSSIVSSSVGHITQHLAYVQSQSNQIQSNPPFFNQSNQLPPNPTAAVAHLAAQQPPPQIPNQIPNQISNQIPTNLPPQQPDVPYFELVS